MSQYLAANRCRLVLKGQEVDLDSILAERHDRARLNQTDAVFNDPRGLLSVLGQPNQSLDDAGVELGREFGEKLVANTGAGAGKIDIGGIFAEGLRTTLEEFAELCPREVEERANEHDARFAAQRSLARDSAQPSQPGTSQDALEDRFGLIVAGMADRHNGRTSVSSRLGQPGIACSPGVALEMRGT
jgi:hypothetical protein